MTYSNEWSSERHSHHASCDDRQRGTLGWRWFHARIVDGAAVAVDKGAHCVALDGFTVLFRALRAFAAGDGSLNGKRYRMIERVDSC